MPVTHEHDLLLMAMFHTHKVERSEVLHSKLVLWSADLYIPYSTSWEDSVKPSECILSFHLTPDHHIVKKNWA